MMTEEEIQNAIDGVKALRPEGTSKGDIRINPVTAKRMTDVQFQLEMAAIMKDESISGSAYFFRKSEPAKGGNKNLNFNPYRKEN